MNILEELFETHYAALGDEEVSAWKVTRIGLSRSPTIGAQCVFLLWHLMTDAARANHIRKLPLRSFDPLDETSRAWVDRVTARVRQWRIEGERELQLRTTTASAKARPVPTLRS